VRRNRLAIPQIMFILDKMKAGWKLKLQTKAKHSWLIKGKDKLQIETTHAKYARAVKVDFLAGKFPDQYGVDHLPPNKIRLTQ